MANLLEKASIILTPTAYSDGKMHSAKPIVSTNPSVGDFDFARASVATRINENGLIEEVASGLPRIDYTDGSGSWLLEPASTNLIPYSELFSNASWTKSGSSLVSNQLSPKGDLSAFKLVEDTSTALHYLLKTISVTSGTSYTYSFFAKYNGRHLQLSSSTGFPSAHINYNLQNGTLLIASGSTVSGTIEKLTDGYYRCTYTDTANATSANGLVIPLLSNSTTATKNINYTGDGTSGIYIFGASLEQNSYATSYIKTVGTAQTRVAETASGSGSSTVINSTEGTLYAEIKGFENDLSARYISVSDGTANNSIRIYYYEDSGTVFFRKNVNGVGVVTLSTVTINKSELTKIAIRYDSTSFDIFSNGVKILTGLDSNSFPINTLNEINFTNSDGVALPFYGKAKSVQVYTTALSDAELISLTTI